MILLIAYVVLSVFSITWNGFALSLLWGWFMVPVFGLPALAVAPAIGLAVVASFLTHQYPRQQGKANEDKISAFCETAAIAMFKPAIALLIGLVVKQWM